MDITVTSLTAGRYEGAEMSAFTFDGEKLVEEFSYYMDGDGCTDDMEPDRYATHYYYVDAGYNKTELTERTYRKRLSGYFKKIILSLRERG